MDNRNNFPEKPRLFTGRQAGILIFSAICIVVFVVILIPVIKTGDFTFLSGVGLAMTATFGFIPLYAVLSSYIADCKHYRVSPEDYAEHKAREREKLQQWVTEQEQRTADMQRREEERRQAELERLPACPICGKKENVVRISTLNRSVSVAAFGLASSKIGMQYECRHCKHKF